MAKPLHSAVTAKNVEGIDLLSSSGDELGTIRDIVFSSEDGHIKSLVVGTGLFGIGGPEHVINMSQVYRDSHDRNDITSNLTKMDMVRAPVFLRERLNTDIDSNSSLRTGDILAVDHINTAINSADGAYLGEVHDWIVDIESASIPYVIVRRVSRSLSTPGHDYFAVPSNRIRGVENGNLYTSISPSDLYDAKPIDEMTPLRTTDEGEVHRFLYRANESSSASL